MDQFLDPEALPEKEKLERASVLSRGVIDLSTYEINEGYQPATSVRECHTIAELIQFAEAGECEIDARVLCRNGSRIGYVKMDTSAFIEASKNPKAFQVKESNLKRVREYDAFLYDGDGGGSGSSLVGYDYTPMMGGPFYKNLYPQDYIRMISTAFFAYNHDPICRQAVQITRDFTLGRGWRADSDNKAALALWESFADVNDLYNKMDMFSVELSVYGESMFWWLPNNQIRIQQMVAPGTPIPRGVIPRIRLIDPSCIWDYITAPEDIDTVYAYQWVAPTQWQTYTNVDATGKNVPGSKFIYQQIPADEIMHFKVNTVTGEKRGRSDLFPILGYAKRLRDSVNYAIIKAQKQSAWSIDTSIEGSQADIAAYAQSQQELGTLAPAGSEFVHTSKVTRTMLAAGAGSSKADSSFEWCLSMCAAGVGIPVSYFGTHLSGGQTKASALVATEPVTKKFEKRQLVLEQALQKMAKHLFKQFNIEADIEFTFPELVSQDRSAKLKDLALAETQGWLKPEKVAPIAAKELGITDYDVETDLGKPEPVQSGFGGSPGSPLSSPGLAGPPADESKPAGPAPGSQADRRAEDMKNA